MKPQPKPEKKHKEKMTSWEFRKKYGRRRSKKTDYQKLIDSADEWFSRMVRVRDARAKGIGHCCSCGKSVQIKYHDCGHFYPRGNMAVRWNPQNGHLQCKYCNMNMMDPKVQAGYLRFMKARYSPLDLEILERQKHNQAKLDRVVLEFIAGGLKKQTLDLLKHKGLEKWW